MWLEVQYWMLEEVYKFYCQYYLYWSGELDNLVTSCIYFSLWLYSQVRPRFTIHVSCFTLISFLKFFNWFSCTSGIKQTCFASCDNPLHPSIFCFVHAPSYCSFCLYSLWVFETSSTAFYMVILILGQWLFIGFVVLAFLYWSTVLLSLSNVILSGFDLFIFVYITFWRNASWVYDDVKEHGNTTKEIKYVLKINSKYSSDTVLNKLIKYFFLVAKFIFINEKGKNFC